VGAVADIVQQRAHVDLRHNAAQILVRQLAKALDDVVLHCRKLAARGNNQHFPPSCWATCEPVYLLADPR
jgi:hypothetical protein